MKQPKNKLIASIILFIASVAYVLYPKQMIMLFDGWKFASGSEPSSFAIIISRVIGSMLIVVNIGLFVSWYKNKSLTK